ncbi:hypothetical protein LXL04_034359 [Taraxacum kok-saghyz]
MITTTRRPRFTMDLMEAGGGDASLPVILGETGCKIAKMKLGEKKEEFYNINPTLLVILIQPLALVPWFLTLLWLWVYEEIQNRCTNREVIIIKDLYIEEESATQYQQLKHLREHLYGVEQH